MRLPLVSFLVAGSLALVMACSDDDRSAGSSGAPDSGVDAGGGEKTNDDAGADASDARVFTPPAPTAETSVEATINGVVRTLHRAQFGITKADGTLYIEAYEGGVPACPEEETPKRTLIVRDVPVGRPGQQFTKSDGVFVTLLDFIGDQIDDLKPSTTATALTVTIVKIIDGESVEIDVDATFPEGTVKGRIYATYCSAMNE